MDFMDTNEDWGPAQEPRIEDVLLTVNVACAHRGCNATVSGWNIGLAQKGWKKEVLYLAGRVTSIAEGKGWHSFGYGGIVAEETSLLCPDHQDDPGEA